MFAGNTKSTSLMSHFFTLLSFDFFLTCAFATHWKSGVVSTGVHLKGDWLSYFPRDLLAARQHTK